MPQVIFEPTIAADERPETYALERAATGTGQSNFIDGFLLTTSVNYRKTLNPASLLLNVTQHL